MFFFKVKIDWPTGWLTLSCLVTKKIIMTPPVLEVCYWLLCTNLGDGIYYSLSPSCNIHRINGVYQWWTTHAFKSKSVPEMHCLAIWTSKFTDFASKTKLNLWEKTAVDKSAWIKACLYRYRQSEQYQFYQQINGTYMYNGTHSHDCTSSYYHRPFA